MDKYYEAAKIERALSVPNDVVEGLYAYVDEQDANRGDWPSPRDEDQPNAPWPAEDNPALRFLLVKARESLRAGMDPEAAVLQAVVHAWFEGGIENYDRGRRDGREPHRT